MPKHTNTHTHTKTHTHTQKLASQINILWLLLFLPNFFLACSESFAKVGNWQSPKLLKTVQLLFVDLFLPPPLSTRVHGHFYLGRGQTCKELLHKLSYPPFQFQESDDWQSFCGTGVKISLSKLPQAISVRQWSQSIRYSLASQLYMHTQRVKLWVHDCATRSGKGKKEVYIFKSWLLLTVNSSGWGKLFSNYV